MAAATYATDLADMTLDMASTTGWTALGGGASGLVAPETDFFIQGNNCISKAGWSSATKGMIYNQGATSITAGKAVFMWVYYWAPNSMATEASGGLQVLIGSGTGAFKQFYVGGSDTLTYGGWLCAVVDPTLTQDATTGSPTSTTAYFGAQANIPSAGPSKGQPLGIDAFRWGRELQITNGDLANGYATFSAAATYDNDVTRRWGLLIYRDGAYYQQGLFLMGSSGTAVDFRDSNRVVFIQNTKKVSSSFNAYEVRNASSRVDWTNVQISALGTVSKGDFIITDNATVNWTSCTFANVGTFTLKSNTTADKCTFRTTGQITHGGATISNSRIESNTATSAIVTTNPSTISGTAFVSSGTGHAIECTSTGTFSLTNLTYSGYASTDGTTGNEAFYNNSGGLITLNISGGASPTVRNSAGSSTTVNNSKTLTITGLKSGSEVRAYLGTNPATATAIDGIESSGTSFAFNHTAGGSAGYIRIMNTAYQELTINLTYPSTDAEIPVSQVIDRNYQP